MVSDEEATAAAGGGKALKPHYKVVVIGGGVVGASVLYHLTKLGWTDVALLERRVLTAGSSWHAAGGFHALNGDPTVAALQAYTIGLYREIEEISGHSCGLHHTGGVNFACSPERWEFLQNEWAKHRTMGIDSKLCTPEECRELIPLLDVEGVIGGLYDKNEGHLDCAGVTWAYAKSARKAGAELHQHTKVTALNQIQRDGAWGWEIETDRGIVQAEHVVNCGGLWAREVGAMAGVHLPLLPMQHHYIVTEDLPEVAELRAAGQQLHALDLDGENYMMTQGDKVLLGVYEQDCRSWGAAESPWDWGEQDLMPPDLDRIAPELERGFERYPVLKNAGIHTVLNGPFTFAPDGNPLVGPVAGTGLATGAEPHNFWAACAVMAGFSQGGGVGLSLAEWMVHGLPRSFPDVMAMDVARFGPWASRAYTLQKSQENYTRRFRIAYPNEELPIGRGVKRSAIYSEAVKDGAVFGAAYGMEYPKYYSSGPEDATETFSFHRSNAFDATGREVMAVREAVGAFDMATFSKYEVVGPTARQWLDGLLAGRVPKAGRMAMAPMLDPDGRLAGDLTVAALGPALDGRGERFMLFGSGQLQGYHTRWFMQNVWAGGWDPAEVTVRNVTDSVGGIAIAGPNSRKLLQAVAERPEVLSADFMPFMGIASVDLGFVPATVCRVSVTGELGYEVTCPAAALPSLYADLRAAGTELGLRPCGSYAMNSLRLEKSYGVWGREYTPDYTVAESGLDRFMQLSKPTDFVGKAAAQAEAAAASPARRLVTLVIEGGRSESGGQAADAWGFEPVWSVDGEYLGHTTSGGYGHSVGQSIAMAYITADRIVDIGDGGNVAVHVLGAKRRARLALSPLYDPSGSKMRA